MGRVFSEETVKKVHSEATVAKDFGLSGMSTKFTQGGVCHFDSKYASTYFEVLANKPREGFYGWSGLGGSCFQWHPELNISFAFAQDPLIPVLVPTVVVDEVRLQILRPRC